MDALIEQAQATLDDFGRTAETVEKRLETLEVQAMLGDEHDSLNSYLFIKPGVLRRIFIPWLRFLRKDFHPWQHDNRYLIDAWEKREAESNT